MQLRNSRAYSPVELKYPQITPGIHIGLIGYSSERIFRTGYTVLLDTWKETETATESGLFI